VLSNWFISLLDTLLSVFSGLLTPAATVTSTMASAVSTVGTTMLGWLALFSPIVNVSLLFTCVEVVVTLMFCSVAFRIANWLFNKIPEIAGFGWGG
jgi:hypothetical protein